MLENLKELCLLNGISGDEKSVREYIISQIKDYVQSYTVDNLGNLIVFKKGKSSSDKKVLISAHMDEVGLIATYINYDGTIKFDTVGGINPDVIIGRQVSVNGLFGVVGTQAIHNIPQSQRGKEPNVQEMYVDIGTNSKEETLKYVSLGDSINFFSKYENFGNDYIKSKALDDRVGCAILIDLIKSNLEFDAYFTFVVQEEVGLRGSKVASYTVNPDYAIVLEGTTAGDIGGSVGEKKVCTIGDGAVVSFMDRRTIYDKELYRLCFDISKENNIPCQTKTMVAGGNDSGSIHISRGGVRTIAISVPCRYIHSGASVMALSDAHACESLAKILISRINNL
ncbi:MAG: M42 family peptidase [Ruminococcus sp.]|nr:M42 family peptidase [Ruminococcus sp.]